ncbi:hypothetical protein [Flavobacterium sp. MDT1-60]|uniref:hypothetical protein n=1 Tax=Flavobacterium sp. MDT1-60 TaxID=1979344 RepID=UPI00177D700C|nr:hypothetical protein [Flavobacterium sp. MDT1-60]QOG02755.1 hypothetical protein IHE43_00470 [Flavobacterium sp. MDT1-60]
MLIAINTAIAQNSSLSKNETITKATSENIFVHLNTTTLVAGETLHCKFYCLNPSNNNLSDISKIAHVKIVNEENQVVLMNKIHLDKATGQGDFFIPTTFSTGNYKLIAYTNWMLNKKDSKVSETDLFIINPYSTSKKNNSNKDSNTQIKEAKTPKAEISITNQPKDESFTLEVDKKIAAKREQISLKIKSSNPVLNKGSFSLSVKKTDNLPSIKPMNSYEFTKSNSNNQLANTINDNILFLPEFRGEMISGSIINIKDPKQIVDKDVALSIPGTDFAFKIVKTDEYGKFNFILDKNPNYANTVLQVVENDRNDYKIEIEKDKDYDLSELKFTNDLNLTSDYKKNIEERSIANQIENAYYPIKKDSIESNTKAIPFYHPLEKEYVLADYTKFPSLKETITEVITEAYYREENNSFTLNVRDINYDLKYFSEPALVLVDGLLIQNVNELVDYKTENIYKVSIVPGIYLYGPKAFNGIISITTKNNDYVSKTTGNYILKSEIQRPLKKTIYFKQDYTDRTKYSRIPDYRYQLLWQPELKLEKTENVISFYTSDVPGVYEINLEGFTEKGIPVTLKETIEVKNVTAN